MLIELLENCNLSYKGVSMFRQYGILQISIIHLFGQVSKIRNCLKDGRGCKRIL